MDRNELKIEHYKQRVAELSVQYEDRVADLRVEVTLLTQQLNEKSQEVEGLRNELAELSPEQDSDTEVSD